MLTIKQIREKIEKTDAIIIKKLAERQKLSKKIGALKAKSGKKVTDAKREKQLMQFYDHLCDKYDLQHRFVKQLFKMIIINSRRLQK